MRPILLAAASLVLASSAALAQTPESRCADLAHLTLDQAHVESATVVSAGSFVAPPRPTGPNQQVPLYRELPSFCRVRVEAAPSSDSEIQIEVWLPLTAEKWNHRFQGQGNGGFAGEIDYQGLARFLQDGYATAGTDTGHFADGIDARWALHHPEKITDFGWRGVHQMTVQAKAVLAAYYGAPAAHNYFASCSDGGREALMEAQRFPADYDGILAGAPAYNWTTLVTSAALGMQTLLGTPGGYIPAAKVPVIQKAVLAQCDARDGVRDGIVADPPSCHFDPARLTCRGKDAANCLTPGQVRSLTVLMSPRPVGDDTVIPPFLPAGAETGSNGWVDWVTGKEKGKSAMAGFGQGYFANMVYSDPHWDYRTFQPVAGLEAARRTTGHALDAADPDLGPFQKRGGRMILYHGWADAAISPDYSIHYYEAVQKTLGAGQTADFLRFYLLPGVKHCAGGPGPDAVGQFGVPSLQAGAPDNNFVLALRDWVEQGTAPGTMLATKYATDASGQPNLHKVQMTRPLCPYPQQAHYQGKGSTKKASSFVCQ